MDRSLGSHYRLGAVGEYEEAISNDFHFGTSPPEEGGASLHSSNGHRHTQCLSICPFPLHVLQGPTGGELVLIHSPRWTSKCSSASTILNLLAMIFLIRAPAGLSPFVKSAALDGCLDVDTSCSYFSLYFITAVYARVHKASTRRSIVGDTSAVLTGGGGGAWLHGAQHPASTHQSHSPSDPWCHQIFVGRKRDQQVLLFFS